MTPLPHNPAILPPGVAPVRPGEGQTLPRGERTRAPQGPSFAEVLQRQTGGVQFSKHALQRVERRGIDLSASTLERLNDAVTRAAGKGARESVVFLDGTAFVVSVKNRTVVTAVDAEHMREHVFTNIDSAVIG
jgi:flagellar operon protein